jgi:hypothetical protein
MRSIPTLLLSLACVIPGARAAETLKPNILLIFTDDQGYSDVSAYGATDVRTPNIDPPAAAARPWPSNSNQ